MREISWLAANLLASQEGLYSMELVSIIYLLGNSHHTSNRWKNYLCQVSTFYGIKEVKQTEPWRGKTPFGDLETDV